MDVCKKKGIFLKGLMPSRDPNDCVCHAINVTAKVKLVLPWSLETTGQCPSAPYMT